MPNILLIEDDKVIAEAIMFALNKDGFNCKWFTLGAQALEYFEKNDVDLILLDIGLPDISGFDVLRIIRAKSDIPVIVLTAREEDSDQVLTIEGLGADDYIVKKSGSDSPRVIIAKIRAQLRRYKPNLTNNTPAVFHYNENLHQVLLKDQVLELTPAELKILSHLVKNPNRLFSKSQLLSVIHDRPVGSDESTIITHIKTIRRKIKAIDGENKYIKTHRGEGYSLIL